MIGFVDLGDININCAVLENVQKLATYVLVFLVKSVVSPLSYSFSNFGTDGITVFQIMPIFWQAVKYLERINLKVIATTADGSSQNRIFFRMHKYICGNSNAGVIYCTKNILAKEMRFIYVFADASHLIKHFEIVFIILSPDVGQDTCGTMFFFMVTYSSFVL